MPEGDSIHRLATQLGRALVGKTIRGFSSHAIADDVARTLVGAVVTAVDAKGKNLLVRFDDGRLLHVHLRMLGRIHVTPARLAASRAALRERQRGRASTYVPQLRIEIGDLVVTGRQIPVLRLLSAAGEARALADLGPDLLSDAFDEAEAVARLRALGAREIGDALLVQRALAGIGNIYKSETLFLERIDPRTPVARVDDDRLRAIVRRARFLLQANIATSGARRTRSALIGPRLWVYDRHGEPCLRCGAPIARIHQGAPPGRSTYHCPECQR